MKSFMASPSTVERKWYVVDAEGKTLGRLASEVANVLRGKNKPTYTPHIDTGDYVIVVNAEKIQVTGKKLDQKIYYHHSEYVGGMKEATLREIELRTGLGFQQVRTSINKLEKLGILEIRRGGGRTPSIYKYITN